MHLRFAHPARRDIDSFLATSRERWGDDGVARYRALLQSALAAIAKHPDSAVVNRSKVRPGIRSFHLRHAPNRHGVRAPVHVIYFRVRHSEIEIVRVMHERMDPHRHLPP